MTDMLVRLYDLPPLQPFIDHQNAQNITIRRAIAPEKHVVTAWIRQHFSEFWLSECEVSYSRNPITTFVAVHEEQMLGFASYDATARGFFGPTGVSEAARGRGTGKALLVATLHDMYQQGYGYAIIGGVGPIEFYNKVVGAEVIENSTPGIYRGMLRKV